MAIIISKKGGGVIRIEKTGFAKERNLQEYIHENPESIPVYDIQKDRRLLVVAREVPTNSGPIDALAIDQVGDIYIVETKLYANADKRRVVAQALDYGASLWKHSDFNGFIALLEKHSKASPPVSFQERAQEFFQLESVDALMETMKENLRDGNLKFIVLMDTMDDGLRDLITFVNQKSDFDIYGVELEFYKHEDLEIVIPKVFGVEVKKDNPKPQSKTSFSEAELMAMADEKKTTDLVSILRCMKSYWREFPEHTAGGSFRYWAPYLSGSRMVFGINISGEIASPPPGALDVWINTDRLALVSGLAEEEVRRRLSVISAPSTVGPRDFVIRVQNRSEAEALVAVLK